ncbi:MAG: hypothetical protein GX134_12185 [candidate division WS1 bacterium]|jgi:hypothetical protein|nr:hypothetical protein [candidate division WS1 bacterium]
MSILRSAMVILLALAIAALAVAQESPSVSVDDDLPVGGPVRPGTIEPAEASTTEPLPELAPEASIAPDPAAAPAVPEAAPPAVPEKPASPEMAYTGFEMVPWMLGSAAIVIMGLALLYWSRRSYGRS